MNAAKPSIEPEMASRLMSSRSSSLARSISHLISWETSLTASDTSPPSDSSPALPGPPGCPPGRGAAVSAIACSPFLFRYLATCLASHTFAHRSQAGAPVAGTRRGQAQAHTSGCVPQIFGGADRRPDDKPAELWDTQSSPIAPLSAPRGQTQPCLAAWITAPIHQDLRDTP